MPSGLRFEEGTKNCGVCGTYKDIFQFERDIERKGLPITEIAFICKSCAVKHNLMKESHVYLPNKVIKNA